MNKVILVEDLVNTINQSSGSIFTKEDIIKLVEKHQRDMDEVINKEVTEHMKGMRSDLMDVAQNMEFSVDPEITRQSGEGKYILEISTDHINEEVSDMIFDQFKVILEELKPKAL